ncbi:expressed unknown protein [Seminavis robusta]|uniref:Uncharacterized protein n=1 Tax=Seminavis robusta TaxID=568900 RepID=A0A9N8DPG1_9STRA|nr:expressed unknown protein [Seminavis robusta]|eukprot:Sro245_g097560.1 n/a (438) ;mRNA; r:74735-76138
MTTDQPKNENEADTEDKGSSEAKLAGLDDVLKLVDTGKLSAEEVEVLRGFVKEYQGLKIKVDRMKGLLGRSAKAQREAKVEAETAKKQLENSLKDVDRLQKKVHHLSTRPTHLDLLNDFETNFDKALLSVGQAGGQETAPQVVTETRDSALDTMLMQELEEARARLSKLESLNSALNHRSAQLEAEAKEQKRLRDDSQQIVSRLELELKMSKMETAQAQREAEENASSLKEMQMEIDMVTKASVKNSALAAQGQQIVNSSKTDRKHVVQLEGQVQALKEWALASGESKRLAMERVSQLENKLKLQGADMDSSLTDIGSTTAKLIFSKSGSLVVGAGDVGKFVVSLEGQFTADKRLVLGWKFDATPIDCTTEFSVIKGKDVTDPKAATYMINERPVVGGAAGELEGAFEDGHCTLQWSNKKSWIRPRTVKVTVQVMSY